MVRRRYVTVLSVPVLPLARYRVVRDGSLSIGRRMPRERDPATAELARELARAEAAIVRCKDDLATLEARCGGVHPDVLEARRGVATALLGAGRTADAARVLEHVAARWEARSGPAAPATVRALDDLAEAHLRAGHLAAFSAAGRQSAGRQRPPGQVDPALPELSRDATRELNTVDPSALYAIEDHAAYIEDCAKRLGPESAETLRAKHSLAVELAVVSRLDEAIRVFEAALAGRVRDLGTDHPDTADTRRLLLLACLDADRRVHDPRRPQFVESATDARRRVLGPDDPRTLASRIHAGDVRWAEGRRVEAITCWKDALADCERVLGADHPLSGLALRNVRRALQPPAT